LADTNLGAAVLLAERGRPFTEIENLIDHYLQIGRVAQEPEFNQAKAIQVLRFYVGLTFKQLESADTMTMNKAFEKVSIKLAQTFLDAVSRGDSKKIIEMARAVEMLKKHHLSSATRSDAYRRKILMLRDSASVKGAKWPIRLLAKIIRWPHTGKDDGFSQLRRICKELNFPITPEKNFRAYIQGK
jgi:hypothetical protein